MGWGRRRGRDRGGGRGRNRGVEMQSTSRNESRIGSQNEYLKDGHATGSVINSWVKSGLACLPPTEHSSAGPGGRQLSAAAAAGQAGAERAQHTSHRSVGAGGARG